MIKNQLIEKSISNDKFVIYGDLIDVHNNFPKESLRKYVPGKDIELVGLDRNETDGISGTQMRDFLKENNAIEYGIEHAIGWFNHVQSSWSKSSVAEGKLSACNETCGIR